MGKVREAVRFGIVVLQSLESLFIIGDSASEMRAVHGPGVHGDPEKTQWVWRRS